MILRLNSKGSPVRELQKKLNSIGFTISKTGPGSPGNETDSFGRLTEEAVKRFQKANGLKDDGVVGPKTWAIILKNEENKIKPIYTEVTKEDFSDPEEEMKVDLSIKEQVPTCPNITELINLINKSNISRNVTRLVFHCTATGQTATVSSIQRYWRESLKWKSPGYHIIIKPDGSWTQLSDFNNTVNGAAGINSTSIHISYIGGIDPRGGASDNRTIKQTEIFETVWRCFSEKMPKLTFHGHNEFSNKACPSFNVRGWIDSIKK
jgi:N-acetylmuramoyl-L-alanine amidase